MRGPATLAREAAILALLAGLPCAASAQADADGSIVVYGDRVHTMAGEVIEDGAVVVIEGEITFVGPAEGLVVDEDVPVREAAVVVPGLVDAHATVGLTGILNQPHDQDQLEPSEPIQPELRAIDAYNPREPLIDWVRSFGVTTVHTGHGPGRLVSGQTMIAKTRDGPLDDVVLVPAAMVAATLGQGAVQQDGSPGTRAKAVAMLRAALIDAREYARARERAARDEERDEERDPPARNLRHEVLARVLDGELPLLVTVHRHHDVLAALRVAEEFGLRLVLDGVADAPLVLDEIRAAGVPVVVHPTMARASWIEGSNETENLSVTTPAALVHAGVPTALQSGYESYVPKTRIVLYEAAMAAAYGLSFDEALATVTIDAARLLDIDERVGSLEVGKDGDLALYDGDPFEYTTRCVGVVVDGVLVRDEPR